MPILLAAAAAGVWARDVCVFTPVAMEIRKAEVAS
jgi:hypothetical protein